MAYVDPETVASPKDQWLLEEVLRNTGDGGWSLARGEWLRRPVMALRWNGSEKYPGIGNPQSRGLPTWFVLPDEVTGLLQTMNSKFNLIRAGFAQVQGVPYKAALREIESAMTDLTGKNLK